MAKKDKTTGRKGAAARNSAGKKGAGKKSAADQLENSNPPLMAHSPVLAGE